jgi:hypothetical protein
MEKKRRYYSGKTKKKKKKIEKRGKAEKGKGEITEHEIMKNSVRNLLKIQGNVQERIWSNSLLIFSNSAWFIDALFHPEEARKAFFEMLILCSEQKMIPARNAIVAHARSFFVNDELLLPSRKHKGSSLVRHTLLEMLDVFVCAQ